MLPSSTCVTRLTSSFWLFPSNASAARLRRRGSDDILMLATPSTFTFINSLVGTASLVFTSTCITLSDNLSTRSKNNSLHPALPIRILRFPLPEIMYAVSGGAFIYPPIKNITTIIKSTIAIGIIIGANATANNVAFVISVSS